MKNLANYGSGPDLKESTDDIKWMNFDKKLHYAAIAHDRFRVWDMVESHIGRTEYDYTEYFDGGVVNHVLCTVNDYSAHQILINIHRTLKPGAELIVIDMDLNKVFESYQNGLIEDIPIEEGDIDDRICFAISGYGTRHSLYTPRRMHKVLTEAGFRVVEQLDQHDYDTRPKESLVFRALK